MISVQAIQVLSVWATGILAGVLCGSWWGQVLSQEDATWEFFCRVHQSQNRTYGKFVPPLMIVSLLAVGGWLGMVVAFARTPAYLGFVGTAFTLLLAGVASTLVVNVPINKRIDRASATDTPPEWEGWRRSWNRGHVFRAIAAMIALLCLVQCLVAY